MAQTQFLTTNKLRSKIDTINNSKITIYIFSATALILAIKLNFFYVLLTIPAYMILKRNPSLMLRSGEIGEAKAILSLRSLPDNYTLFNQVKVPCPSSQTGWLEIDILVVGPNGIFAIEVKNSRGNIYVDEKLAKWHVRRISKMGKYYSVWMRNPIKQVKRQIVFLDQNLEAQNLKNWIQGIVLFTNNQAFLNFINPASIPVLKEQEIIDFILNYKSNIPQKKQEDIIQNILTLDRQ